MSYAIVEEVWDMPRMQEHLKLSPKTITRDFGDLARNRNGQRIWVSTDVMERVRTLYPEWEK